uniref:Serpin domain-containing protein n=2 Tax=Heliothis virescens TaxID=7102 RepID=A0A2A4IR33_HELVI
MAILFSHISFFPNLIQKTNFTGNGYFIYLLGKRTLILAMVAATMSSETDDLLKESNEHFTAKMFQKVIKLNPGKNVVMSAFSVLSPLAQLALASVGESHDEILKAIGLSNDNVTKEVFLDANKQLRSLNNVELNLANRVC